MCARSLGPRRLMIVLDGTESPSAHVRGMQYQDLFRQQQDYDVTYTSRKLPFMSRVLRSAHPPVFEFAARALRRPLEQLEARIVKYQEDRIAERAADFDVIYELKVPSIRLHERLCRLNQTKVVMDLSDGLWLPFHRQFGWQKLEDMLRTAHGVICENEFVADYARKYNPKVFIVRDPPQVEAFDLWRTRVKRDPARVVLGWVGTRATVSSLYAIWEPLEELFGRHSELHLRIVGAAPDCLPRFEKINWSACSSYNQEEMVREVLAMDIGLFPLFNVEDSLARGALKAMVYMSGGAVAVSQNLGESRNLITDGSNGMLASTHQEWVEKLEWLVEHPKERQLIASRGLETIREGFSRQKCFERLLSALANV